MEIKKISDALSVGPQLYLTDLAEVAKAGFKSIMVNRPDAEADDQPTFAEVDADARRHGLQALYVPVVAGKITDENVAAFAVALEALPKPIFGFCRTGTRTNNALGTVAGRHQVHHGHSGHRKSCWLRSFWCRPAHCQWRRW